MKAIEFAEVNVRIGEYQEEYQTLPVHVQHTEERQGLSRVTMCFELDADERRQVAESGQIWITVLQPGTHHFHPIVGSTLKPEL